MKHSHGQSVVNSTTGISFGSVCSGIEAASVAWEPLGWKAAWFAEIEPFPSAVLAHHWPETPNLGDMTKIRDRIKTGEVLAPDVLVGGTPCQAFSVAGARQSLDDDRGQLTLEFVRLANEIDTARSIRGQQPAVIVWENVPGVLSTKDNAFGCFLGALSGEDGELQPTGKKWPNAGCVFGAQRTIAWRILDAQYFGLAQRRKRVFVVASARKGFNPAEVLFEWEGMRRDSPPCRGPGQEAAGRSGSSVKGASHWDNPLNPHPTMNQSHNIGGVGTAHGYRMTAFGEYADDETASTMKMRDYKDATDLVVHGTQDPITQNDMAFPLGRNQGQENVVCFNVRASACDATKDLSPTMRSLTRTDGKQNGSHGLAVAYGIVRRLIPIECERLQGFPDNHTLIPYRNKPAEDCPDGPRYAALGNSMAVYVMRWIGKRIKGAL